MVKHIKPPKPANVQDPSQGHTVRLLHGQSLRLCMHEPSYYSLPNSSEWEVVTNSEYFSLVSNKKIKGKKSEFWEFIFEPKSDFDAEHAASLSTLFIGNITILAKRDDDSHLSDLHRNLCVFLQCSNPAREKIVTVVNPTSENIEFIKLEYDNILEVVLDEDRHSFDWRSYAFPKDDTPANLRLNKSFYACIPAGRASQSLDQKSLYYCERRLPKGAGSVPLVAEHHFFFEFDGLNDVALSKINGSFPYFDLVFVGKPKIFSPKLCRQSEIHVELTHKIHEVKIKKGKVKGKSKASNKMELLREVDLTDRVENTGLLFNPKKTDRITLTNFQDSCVLEICNPSDYWKLPTRLNALWHLEVSSSAIRQQCPRNMVVVSLPSRYIKESVIQRWEVRCENVSETVNAVMLGIINLSCPEIDKLKVGQSKSIHVLFERKVKNETPIKPRIQSSSSIKGDYDHHLRQPVNQSQSDYYRGMREVSRKKQKQFVSIYEPVYSEVSIEDVVTTRLTDGEKYELMEKILHQSPTLLLGYDSRSDSSIHANDWSAYTAFCEDQGLAVDCKNSEFDFLSFRQGMPPFDTLVKPHFEEDGKKKGEVSDKNNPENSTANGPTCVPKSDTAIPTARKTLEPLEVYGPADNTDIILERGQPLLIRLTVPHSKNDVLRSPWTINVVDSHEDLKIWVESSKIVQGMSISHQEIEVRIMFKVRTEMFEEGNHFAGIVRLQNEDELRQLKLSVRIHQNSKFESLYHWKSYWKAMRQARLINYGLECKQYSNRFCNNRTTLVNPLGKTIEVPVDDKEELEILLEKPSVRPKDGEYDLQINTLDGVKFECRDSSIWTLWNGNLIQRFLLAVTKTSDKLYSEMKIAYDGEDTSTRIRLYSKKKQEVKHKFMPVITTAKRTPNRIMVSGWRHEQSISISPFDEVHVQIPNIENFLTLKMKNLIERDSWGVELIQDCIDPDLKKLLAPIVTLIDDYAFWYPHDGLLSESVEPWNYFEYILPSLEKSCPFILVALDRLKKLYGNQKEFRMGELKFTCRVKEQFTISQSLNLFVLNPDYKHKSVKKHTELTDFIDKTKIALEDNSELFIDLQGKWSKDRTYNSTVFTPWRLISYSTWLRPLNRGKSPKDTEFEFLVQLPKDKTHDRGEIVFVCGNDLKKTLYIEASKL